MALYKAKQKPKALLKDLSVLLMPFAPHLAEEIWKALGGEGYASKAEWPSYDESLVKEDTVSIGVQVNGKMRGSIELSLEATEDQAVAAAKEIATVQNAIGEAEIRKVIYRAGKILNIIAK